MAQDRASVDEPTDEDLVTAFRNGNEEAFNRLVGRYKDQLLNCALRYLGNYDEADDVVQETLIRLYRKPASYRPIARFSTWLYTIAINLAKTQLRRRKRRTFFSISSRSGSSDGASYDIPDSRYAADRDADSALKEVLIRKALNSLGEKQREIVVLCDIQELSYDEICVITGLNMGTVKSRLNRARVRLQELLKDVVDQ
jgi:RNA polymerase sigma-70 factor (ECF subfamily)